MKHSKHEESRLAELPIEVIQKILLRLPLKSLGKCKLVSKLWHSLISNPEFATVHLQFSNHIGNSPSILALDRNKLISIATPKIDSSMDMITDGAPCLITLDREFNPPRRGHDCVFLVGSCHGLVCLYLKKIRKPEDLMYLWNPTIDKHKHIPLPIEQGLTYVYARPSWFGFISSLNTYKIFLVYKVHKQEYKYVCSLRDLKWREIREVGGKVGILDLWKFKSVVMNEALHFLIGRECILRFDLVAETFENIPLSIKPDVLPRSCRMLLGVLRENTCLCALVIHWPQEWIFDLWILEEYNKWDSWKKMYKIDLETNIGNDFGFIESGYYCVEGEKELVLIGPSHNPPLFVNVEKNGKTLYKLTYHVENLVSPLCLP